MIKLRLATSFFAFIAFIGTTANAFEINEYPISDRMSVINLDGLNDDDADALELTKIFQKQFEARRPFFIQLNSEGGDLEAALQLSSAIVGAAEHYRRFFGKPLYLVTDVTCQSACTIIMANLTRGRLTSDRTEILRVRTTADAEFKFHGAANKDKDRRTREMRESRVYAAYLNAGVNAEWLAARKDWFKSTKLHNVSGAQLCRDSAGIVPGDACRADIDVIMAEILK